MPQNGSFLPQTPSRSKSKSTPRTTPHSQRIVPSSQYFSDELASLASSLGKTADESDPFTLNHSREPDEELILPSLFKLPYPPSRAPTSVSSSSLPFASVSSIGCTSQHRSQNSQIVPTSQLDEVELRFSSESQVIAPPVCSSPVKHSNNASSLKRYACRYSFLRHDLHYVVQLATWTSAKFQSPFPRQSHATGVIGRYPSHISPPSFEPADTSNAFLPPSPRV